VDFEDAAVCLGEIKRMGRLGAGAAYRLSQNIAASSALTPTDKELLLDAVRRAFPPFRSFDHFAVTDIEELLLQHDQFKVAWVTKILSRKDSWS